MNTKVYLVQFYKTGHVYIAEEVVETVDSYGKTVCYNLIYSKWHLEDQEEWYKLKERQIYQKKDLSVLKTYDSVEQLMADNFGSFL